MGLLRLAPGWGNLATVAKAENWLSPAFARQSSRHFRQRPPLDPVSPTPGQRIEATLGGARRLRLCVVGLGGERGQWGAAAGRGVCAEGWCVQAALALGQCSEVSSPWHFGEVGGRRERGWERLGRALDMGWGSSHYWPRCRDWKIL